MLFKNFSSFFLTVIKNGYAGLFSKGQPTKHHHHSHGNGHAHHHGDENHWQKASLGLVWGALLLIVALGGIHFSFTIYSMITLISTMITLYIGQSVYSSAWRAMRKKKWNMESLYSISTLTITLISIISLVIPELPMMLEAAPFILGFWHLGEAIEHTLLDKIHDTLDVRDCLPETVYLKDHSDPIPVKNLKMNDEIIIMGGQVIPVDAVLTAQAPLFTKRVTGSAYPKTFEQGEEVKAGMELLPSSLPITMRVLRSYQDSHLSVMARNIKKANDEKAPIELFANKILNYFVPGLLVVSLISGFSMGMYYGWSLAMSCMISVLVSACPCALSLITPMAVKIGMNKAADNGMLFKNGKVLQAAADIDTVVFDLNGTLTQGEISVRSFHLSNDQYLPYIALLENESRHPIGQLIVNYIAKLGHPLENNVRHEHINLYRSGVTGRINDAEMMIGNDHFLMERGMRDFNKIKPLPGCKVIYIVYAKEVVGHVMIHDPLREDAIATVQAIMRSGRAVHICTGSDHDSAMEYATLLGVPKDQICANSVGVQSGSNVNSKVNYIQVLKRQGKKVAMVGDALNDIEAVICADLGIAVKSAIGDKATAQQAGIELGSGSLFSIVKALDLAQKTRRNIYQNLVISLGYNSTVTLVAAGLLAGLGWTLSPILGVACMVLESTIVFSNMYRLKQQVTFELPEPVAYRQEDDVSYRNGSHGMDITFRNPRTWLLPHSNRSASITNCESDGLDRVGSSVSRHFTAP